MARLWTLTALVQRINGKNPTRGDIDALRHALDAQDGSRAGLTVLDGSAILNHVLDKYTDDVAPKLVMQADARRMAKTLGRDTAPPFERPLIDHIVLCWVRLQLVERDMSNNTSRFAQPGIGRVLGPALDGSTAALSCAPSTCWRSCATLGRLCK